MVSGMAIPYCDVHERLFDPQRHAWIQWSRMYVEMVQRLCAMLDAEHIACGDYKVTPTACDRCTTIARQAVDEHIDPCDQSQ
jgi:uncharacterized cysteine cluster protein YcgN (CxxCxxCC family)